MKVPTSAETGGRAQEAPSQEEQQEGENSTELLELEATRQGRKHSAKRFDPIETGGIIEGSPRQEASSHQASPPKRVDLKVPAPAEIVGKAQ